MIHRDLKPDNFMVDENWRTVVGDFGLSRLKRSSATMTHCGTPTFAAPEILTGIRYDERVDVCKGRPSSALLLPPPANDPLCPDSFGISLFVVVARRAPFGHGHT